MSSEYFTVDNSIVRAAAKRAAKRCDLLGEVSDQADNLTRTFCSPAMKKAHDLVRGWMRNAGMNCELDAAGNLVGQFVSGASDRPVFMIGSHLDTVVNAGRFDGTLGMILGLATVEVLRQADVNLDMDIHVVGFSEEEGVRYSFPFIGSLGMVGELEPADLQRLDRDGVSMKDALLEFGCDVDDVADASYQSQPLVGFMEAHIEQAGLLEEADVPVGVVVAIAGQTRAKIVLQGQAGHAGTVLHDRRQDALAAAAELILEIESIGKRTEGLFATVGSVEVSPGLSNVISGRAEIRLDLRHKVDDDREKAFKEIEKSIELIAKSRNVKICVDSVQHTPATMMDYGLMAHVSEAVHEAGIEIKPMVSGAGHDAMILSRIAPSCMLFIRCRDGVSHHPDEFVSPEDVYAALQVMVHSMIRISQNIKQS
jgi:allantoate deiminase